MGQRILNFFTSTLMIAFLLLIVSSCDATGLRDEPLLGDAIQYLDGNEWIARSSSGLEIGAMVPGDLVTDLQRANVIEDPLFELNWLDNASLWDSQDWTYKRDFVLADASWLTDSTVQEIYLVFDGVKMAADLSLNGNPLGVALNQFLRYSFPVKALLSSASPNAITVSFAANDDRIDPEVRFMPCAGGWDWAPYSAATGVTPGGVRTFGKGIWKSVYLVPVRSAAITAVSTKIFYNGDYPTAPLSNQAPEGFYVSVIVYLLAPNTTGPQVTGKLIVDSDWSPYVSADITIPAGVETPFNITMYVAPTTVNLWWPNGMGSQPLYTLSIAFVPSGSYANGATLVTQRRIGFRIFALVTDDDSNPSQLQDLDGNGNLTMRFKVNGADMFSRGSNFIPMEELDGRSSARALYWLMKSAADAGMNTIRIWGGGVWQYDAFYDAADEFGLMLYHDMMYSDQGDSFHMAAPTAMQSAEIRYQLRRLSHHPSIVIWDGCNECGASGVFESFVLPIIASEDPTRALWPACPSSGFASGVDRLWSLPNGSPAGLHIKTRPFELNETSNGVCQQGGWYHGFPLTPFLYPFPSPSPESCIDSCTNVSGCMCGMYADQSCQLKGFEYLVPTWGGETLWACFPTATASNIPNMPLPSTFEQHGPYQGGGGWPTANAGSGQPFDTDIPSNLKPIASAYGTSAPGIFTSEFGTVAVSSFESMSATLASKHWSMHGGEAPDSCGPGFHHICNGSNPMAQRNYACDSFWDSYYGDRPSVSLDDAGVEAFKAQTYLCQLASALEMKGNVEWHRSENLWGLLIWQLNEIWPTIGWGSVEYGTTGFTPNQVIGGRWKPTHYWYRSLLNLDLFAACGRDGRCYVKNDSPLSGFNGTLQLTYIHLRDGARSIGAAVSVSLSAGANAISWFCSNGKPVSASCPTWQSLLSSYNCDASGTDCLLLMTVTDVNGNVALQNPTLLANPGNLSLPSSNVVFTVGDYNATTNSVPITLTADAPALYIMLTTLASGRFSDNAFHLLSAGSATISFVPFDDFDYDKLVTTLRIEHLGQYLQ